MCHGCWVENGMPSLITDVTKEAARLVDEIYGYADGGCGGNAHIVVDDWNLDDDDIKFCIKAANKNEWDFSDDQIKAELDCLNFMLKMSEPERYSAMAIHEGHIDANNSPT